MQENEDPTFVAPLLLINRTHVPRTRNRRFELSINMWSRSSGDVGTQALIDSGAEDNFIDNLFVEQMGFETMMLEEPLKVFNVDGTANKVGTITEFVRVLLEVQGHQQRVDLLVTGLGRNKVLLGMPWLEDTNPDIN